MTLSRQELVRRRKALGLNQKELALKAGIDPANLSKIERDKRYFGDYLQSFLDGVLTRLEAQ